MRLLGAFSSIVLHARAAKNGLSVCKMIFSNNADSTSATLDFTRPLIVENIFLSEKVEENLAVDNMALTESIIRPKHYASRLEQALRTQDINSQAYKNAQIKQIEVDMTNANFQENRSYSFKIKPLGIENVIYTEAFIFSDGKLIHEQEKKKSHWYTNTLVLCSVILAVLVFLMILKLLFF